MLRRNCYTHTRTALSLYLTLTEEAALAIINNITLMQMGEKKQQQASHDAVTANDQPPAIRHTNDFIRLSPTDDGRQTEKLPLIRIRQADEFGM